MKLLTSMMSNNMEKNPYLKQSEWSWTIDEIGFRIALNDIYRRYKKPIIILECGIGVDEKLNDNMSVDDDYRIDYFKNHLVEMKKAIEIDGVDCFGFLTWGPIDDPSFYDARALPQDVFLFATLVWLVGRRGLRVFRPVYVGVCILGPLLTVLEPGVYPLPWQIFHLLRTILSLAACVCLYTPPARRWLAA